MDWKRRAWYTCMRARQKERQGGGGEWGGRGRNAEWVGQRKREGGGGRERPWSGVCVMSGSIHQLRQRWDKPGRRHSYLGQLLHFSRSRWERLTLVTMWIRRTVSMKRPEWPWFGVVANELLQSPALLREKNFDQYVPRVWLCVS